MTTTTEKRLPSAEIERLQTKLQARWTRSGCPFCGSTKWTIHGYAICIDAKTAVAPVFCDACPFTTFARVEQ